MSYPPRPPGHHHMGMPPMFGSFGGPPGGMPPMGIPPLMPGQGGNQFYGGPPMPPNTNIPPPLMRNNTITKPPMLDEKPMDHPMPYPQPTGPPVTVFVGNITEKWPDAMIRQLLSTCGQVINWKRVQGASGKLQGFGFCEFNGPDAGLRAVRLLHDLQVGDKKMVVKVDAKTQSLLEEYKAEKRKKKSELPDEGKKNGSGDGSKSEDGEIADYMDNEMKEFDERSKQRVEIIFREFKNEIEAYIPPGSEKAKADAAGSKQQIQDKLHLLKLSSIDATLAGSGMLGDDPDLPEELAQDEGKREIITREISIFRESMKQEQEREEERKRLGRERREKEREREERNRQRERESNKGAEDITSPDHLLARDRREKSGSRERGNRDRGLNRDNNNRRDNNRRDRDRRDRSRDRRRRSRERRSKSRSVERILRSPGPISLGPKPRYREREEEEEQVDQKRLERKAREKEAAYEQRLRDWETREAQKTREYKKIKDRLKRQEEELQKEAKKMKQFLEDYDDEKYDSKYFRGKELQKRLGDRARELEDDNKDRQREREELEEMKLRMMTSAARATPNSNSTSTIASTSSLLDKYKKPSLELSTLSPTTPSPLFSGLKMELKPSINSRLQALATTQSQAASASTNATTAAYSSSNHVSETNNKEETPFEIPESKKSSVPTNPPIAGVKILSNPTTPNPLISPVPVASIMKSPASATKTTHIFNQSPIGKDDEDSRQSFSPAPSPGMASVSPQNFNSRDDDDSSMHSPLDAPKRKKIDVKDVFNQDEDDTDGFGLARKRKLVPLDFGDEANKKARKEDKNPEEKKQNIKALIDKIPTDKDALFEYEIDWEMVDTSLMEKRIRPWINKKIVEYIGEPEPTLVDFICSKVLGRSAPKSILEDVVMVLDEEAEVFVVKMWRLLVYECEYRRFFMK